MRKNKLALFFVLTLSVALVTTACGGNGGGKKSAGNPVASVNYKKITDRQIEQRLALFQIAYGHQFSRSEMGPARSAMAEQMIDEYVALAEAKKQGIRIKDEDVSKETTRLKSIMRDRAYGGSVQRLNMALKQAGITDEDLKAMVKDEMIIRSLHEKVTGGIKLDPNEARQYYEANKAQMREPESVKYREIRVSTEEEARRALDELKGGADFVEVAKKYAPQNEKPNIPQDSTHSGVSGSSGIQGPPPGELMGPFYKGSGQIVKEVEDTAFALEAGQTSGLVQSAVGYHIIKVEELKPAKEFSFEEVRDRITNGILEQKKMAAWDKYIADLREKAKIKKF